MLKSLNKNELLDLLFPPYCALCDKRLGSSKQPLICEQCNPGIKQLDPHLVTTYLNKGYYVYSFGSYEGGLAKLIQKLKFGKDLSIAPVLGNMLANHARIHLSNKHYDRIVPVPMHTRSIQKRGFNHAKLIGQYVKDILRIPHNCSGLVKTRYTKDQARLNTKERKQNLINAFKATRSYHGESCLIVDDVYTTGITAETCAKTLKDAGALRVDILTVARTV